MGLKGRTSEERLLQPNMDSKCILTKLNKNNCALKGYNTKLIYFGEFWSRHQIKGPQR